MVSVAGFVIAASSWSALPDRIPLHFDGAGTPDRWGGKAAIWWLPSIGLALVGGRTALQRFPWGCNIPVRVTAANALRQYRLVNRLLGSLSALLSLTFAHLVWGVGEAASTPGSTLAAPMIPLHATFSYGLGGEEATVEIELTPLGSGSSWGVFGECWR